MFSSLLRPATQGQTYINILYSFVSLILGSLYFAIVIAGIVSSITMLLIGGILIIVLFLSICWYLAAFERKLAMKWLHVDIPPMSVRPTVKQTWLQKLQAHLNNPVTWKSHVYLFIKFPYSLLAFQISISMLTLMISLSVISLVIGLILAPFVYLVRVLTRRKTGGKAVGRYLLISLTACGLAGTPLYLVNGIAWLWGRFARLMLGMSDNDLRLAQANVQLELERARAELAERKRRELIINVSHDLRTPVASIRGHVESLLTSCGETDADLPSSAVLRKYLTIVHGESVRLGNLVDDLLSLARTETSELQLNMAAIEAGEVVEEVYQTLMPLARRERQITIVRSIAPGLPCVMADRQRLGQVLLNLVRNAITYTPDGGIVSISLEQAGEDNLSLSVSDTGIGIPPEDQQRIFERFYRTDASRTRASGGFGLGLAIVRDFVLAMGGSVSVNSVVGEGSCFQVLLRIAQHAQSQRFVG
ncbi:MAG: sensor domain-containing protein [Chloroflexi bacterium]|nr:sensor domain-containing protein [Chloroflexota bacterium]